MFSYIEFAQISTQNLIFGQALNNRGFFMVSKSMYKTKKLFYSKNKSNAPRS